MPVAEDSCAGLGAMHCVDLDTAGPRDGAIFELLTGRPAEKLLVISSRLLTATHSAVLRDAKVSNTSFLDS